MKCDVILWGWCETIPIWIRQALTMPGWQWLALISPQLTIFYSPVGPSDLACGQILANLWVVLANGDGMEGVMILWECCGTVSIPPASLKYPWVTIVGLASTSTHHSSSASGPVCFVSWSNADKFLSGSSTWWWHGKCCESIRLLWNCSHISTKPTTCLGNNDCNCFHLMSPFFFSVRWPRQIWLMVKCWMMANYVLALVPHGDCMGSVVMLWGCSETTPHTTGKP
jgi:hypothetical protein